MSLNSKKSFLFIIQNTPWYNISSQEYLDLILATSIYEEQISLLFIFEGIYHLLKSQNSSKIARQPFTNLLQTLKEHYDINTLYLHAPSLKITGLKQVDLLDLNYTLVNNQDLDNIFNKQIILSNPK